MKPATLFLFDLDGTLVDSLPDITEAVNAALEPLSQPPRTPDEVRPHVGRGAAALLAGILGDPDLHSPIVRATIDRFMSYYQAHLTCHTLPYPGVLEVLEHFRQLPMIVVSNKPVLLARGVLEALGLSRYFRAIYGGDSFERKKPDPLPLLEALRPWGGPSTRVIMVGDSELDVMAGLRAGVSTCGVLYGLGSEEELRTAGADLLVREASALISSYYPAV